MLTTKNKTTRKVGVILTLFIALFMVVSSVLTVNAETLESNSNVLVCEKQEHTHSEECYDQEGNLICGLEEHTHDENCYEAQQENKEEEKQEEETPVVENKEETNTEVDPTTTNNDNQPVENKQEDNQEVTTPETTEVVEENKEEEKPVEEITDKNNAEVVEENKEETVGAEEFDLDFYFDEDEDAIASGTLLCGKEYHVHSEECYNESKELICDKEEHIHVDEPDENGYSCYLSEEEMKQLNAPKKLRLLAAPSDTATRAVHKIGRSWIVTEEENPREHTYVMIAGTKYDLHKNESFDEFSGTVPLNSRVKLSIVFEVRDKGVAKGKPDAPLLYYELPNNLSWDNKSGFIKNANNPLVPAGTYWIADNTIYIQYSNQFWKDNSKIDTRVNVYGHVIESESGEGGKVVYDFTDMGKIENVEITNERSLDLEKYVATDMPDYLVVEEDGSVTVTYVVEVRTVGLGNEIKNFKLKDTVTSDDDANLNPTFKVESIKFGSAPGENDRFDIVDEIEATNAGFEATIKELNSDETGPLYVAYAINFTPKVFGGNYDQKQYVKVGNEVTSTYSDGKEGPKATDDFVYRNGGVIKSGTRNQDESYVADWTATFNDYAPLYGVQLGDEDYTTIKDTLDTNHEPYNTDKMSVLVYEPNDTNTGYKASREATEEDYAQMKDSSGITIEGKESFATNFFSNGVQVPIVNKYIIKYQTKLKQNIIDQLDADGDTNIQNVNNTASNGNNSMVGGPVTQDKDVGVGPAKPKITKTYDKDNSTTSSAAWTVSLEIRDEKVQTTGWIYDYLGKSHSIDTEKDIIVTIEDIENGTSQTLDPVKWNSNFVEKESDSYIDNGSNKTTKTVDDKEVYNSDFQENFKVNIYGLAPAQYKVIKDNETVGLKKGYRYKFTYYTKLVVSEETVDQQSPVSNQFSYTNNAFAVVKNDNSVIESPANTTRNIIMKYDMDSSKELYEKATGRKFDDLAFQEIPWYISVLVLKNNMVLTDAYHEATAGYGKMELDQDSLVVYQTTKADKVSGSIADVNWNTDAKKLTEGTDYTLVVNKVDGIESGFELHFKNLSMEDNSRVVVFYVTRGGDDYDNDLRLVYQNSATPDYGTGGHKPSASDYTERTYKILDKKAQYDESEESPLLVHYTVDVNTSKMDLDDGDILNLVDNLKQYLVFIDGSFEFYDVQGTAEIKKEPGEEGYSVDVSEDNNIKITVPDETHVRIKYDAMVNYPAIEGENVEAINEVTLTASKTFVKSNNIAVKVVEHEASARGTTIQIRLYKYDLDDPEKALPGTTFKISAFHTPHEDDPTKKLYPDNSQEFPMVLVTDESGQISFPGHYDTIYKIEEIIAPDGYDASPNIEYFCFTGFKNPEDFMGFRDENGKEINPYIHLISEVNEIRVTAGNRKQNTSLLLKKVNRDGVALTGAKFRLRTVKGEVIYEELEVDEKGELLFSYLEAGEYFLDEIQAPKGMQSIYDIPIRFYYDGKQKYIFDYHDFLKYIPASDEYEHNVLMFENWAPGWPIKKKLPKTGVE